MIALVVTVACLPLLVLDLLGQHGGGTSESAVVSSGVPQPSMVVAVSPSEAPTSSTSTTVTTVAEPTVSTTATTAVPRTTTTTAPKAVARATTTTTAAPQPVYVAPPPPAASGPTPTGWESSFLACVRQRESHGDYTAVNPTGTFMGAYQIYQGGWDAVARSIGRGDLVGVRPNTAAPADQDTIALSMLRQYGTSPWGGACG